ncbi:outer membrane usher protein [Yersinia nurmii]|uniref:Outer membrane usher protein n=1 Tax=Yersinia nurmii TaxID=685706 RepID=A0ABM9S6F0_9GAMM|nr:fimbria/pilus outer membrane usher protein [Yersinia nurmii]CNE29102.1 outer membrane usher protein [Yersinia nurmii]
MKNYRHSPFWGLVIITTGFSGIYTESQADEVMSELPPPPSALSADQAIQYQLELVINQYATGQVVPVEFRRGHYLVQGKDLEQAGIVAEHLTFPTTDISANPNIKLKYDSENQRLLLDIPTNWLPNQTLSNNMGNPKYQAVSSAGALFNYDIYASRYEGNSQLAAWSEQRLFGTQGYLSNSGVIKQTLAGESIDNNGGYLRYDTRFSHFDETNAVRWQAGDLITDSLTWSNSIRVGGLSVSRDFSIRPDIITFPLPQFSGQAVVPTSVDLFINGNMTSSNNVRPGPFTLTNVPFINGAGEATVITNDALGRQVSVSLPFYVASTLLKPGLSDYAFSTGAIRRGYGVDSFNYGPAAVSGSYRYGVTNYLTLESHAEGAESLALGGVGSVFKLGNLGVVNASYSQSQMRGQNGDQISLGYQYNTGLFNLGTQQTYRSDTFGNLAIYDNQDANSTNSGSNNNGAVYSLSRRSAQYSASIMLNEFGNLGAAYIDVSGRNDERTRLLNLSWSRTLFSGSNLYISATRDIGASGWSGAVSLVIPFGALSNTSISSQRSIDGQARQQVSYSRGMPSDGGLSWDLAYAHQSNQKNYQQASLNWRNASFESSIGAYGNTGDYTQWADLSGSLVLMDKSLFATNRISDAFVLVNTNNYPNVRVRYENQLIGVTDSGGHLLVPRVTSYYPAKYDIDTTDLPAGVQISNTEKRLSVQRNSGYMINFDIKKSNSLSFVAVDQQGKSLPVSSRVLKNNQTLTYVGWDGIVYLEALDASNSLKIITPDGRQCQITVPFDASAPQPVILKSPIVCPLIPAQVN